MKPRFSADDFLTFSPAGAGPGGGKEAGATVFNVISGFDEITLDMLIRRVNSLMLL
jgi:hypothetical protein